MQTRGTFPELSAGRSKRTNASGRYRKEDNSGFTGGFHVNGRGPRKQAAAPKTFAGRRAASHAAAKNR